MNTQYRKNLKAVLEASKNYADTKVKQEIDNLKWELGTYDLNVTTDNTTALVKTMPSGTIMANVNKIKGASEVSENLIALNDVAEYTTNGITFKVQDGIIYINGTNTASVTIGFTASFNEFNGQYSILLDGYKDKFGQGAQFKLNGSYKDFIGINTDIKTLNTNFNEITFVVLTNETINVTIKPMMISGSTAPTTYKPYYSGIHNLELSGVRVEGANLYDDNGVDSIQYVGNYYLNGATYNYTIASNSNYNGFRVSVKENTTYYIKEVSGLIIRFEDSSKNLISGRDDLYYDGYGSFTTPSGCAYIFFSKQKASTLQTMLNYGSTVLDYVPYIQPTIIPIDLTTIEDSGGNKLFADGSLKGVGSVYDEITPIKAIKRYGIVDLGSLNWTYTNDTDNTYIFRSIISAAQNVSLPANNATVYTKGILSNNYTLTRCYSSGDVYVYNLDKSFAIRGSQSNYPYGAFEINDSSYTTAAAFKSAMSGVYLVYELATPIEADINFSFLKKITGYSNGSVTAQNTYDMPVPSDVDYLIEEVKA